MRAEFLRGKRKEESSARGNGKEESSARGKGKERGKRKEELGLRVKRQKKGVLWARKEHKEIEGQKLKGATTKEMKRNRGMADQENHYKRKGVDLHYPCQPTSHMRRLYKQKRELPHPKLGIFTSQNNHIWDQRDFHGECFFPNDNRGGLSWANALVPPSSLPLVPLVPPASLRPPMPTPSLAQPHPPTPSTSSHPAPPQTLHFVRHTPQRLSVITSTSDVSPWNEVKP